MRACVWSVSPHPHGSSLLDTSERTHFCCRCAFVFPCPPTPPPPHCARPLLLCKPRQGALARARSLRIQLQREKSFVSHERDRLRGVPRLEMHCRDTVKGWLQSRIVLGHFADRCGQGTDDDLLHHHVSAFRFRRPASAHHPLQILGLLQGITDAQAFAAARSCVRRRA